MSDLENLYSIVNDETIINRHQIWHIDAII